MRKSILLASFFVLTTYFYMISEPVSAEGLPASQERHGETLSDNKGSVTDTNLGEKLKPVDVEIQATFEKEPNQLSEGQSAETIGNDENTADDTNNEDEDEEPEQTVLEGEIPSVKDPIQPYNRAVFTFNDKAYYYVIKPVYRGYNKVLSEPERVCVRNFFSNIKMPVRLVNCLLQGKFKGAGIEALRFFINSTMGFAGFLDPAKSEFHLEKQERDFGQTLGKYKIGSGPFVEWPFIGPSTVRDTFGYVGDLALNPMTLVSFFIGPWESFGTNSYDTVNEVSLDKGDTYESITKPAIDPYIAIQDAYIQNRIKKIKE